MAEMLGRARWVLRILSPVGRVTLDGWLQAELGRSVAPVCPCEQIAGASGLVPVGS